MDEYGTDNGPRCACGGTIYSYKVDESQVTAQCVSCKNFDYFRMTEYLPPLKAAIISGQHRASARDRNGGSWPKFGYDWR